MLFNIPPREITFAQGTIIYQENFLDTDLADHALGELRHSLNWEQSKIEVYGKKHLIPRLNCLIGERDYSYSGKKLQAQPWPTILLSIKAHVEEEYRDPYNICLANLYRDGQDSVGWHSDDEAELGANPTIAMLSLGATRCFQIRDLHHQKTLKFNLPHNSLLIMKDLQHSSEHCLSKTNQFCEQRISLTFRQAL